MQISFNVSDNAIFLVMFKLLFFFFSVLLNFLLRPGLVLLTFFCFSRLMFNLTAMAVEYLHSVHLWDLFGNTNREFSIDLLFLFLFFPSFSKKDEFGS